MRKHLTALRALVDYLPFLAMLVPSFLVVAAAAVSLLPKAPAAGMASAILPIESACDRAPDRS
jgi:hypothetical protein